MGNLRVNGLVAVALAQALSASVAAATEGADCSGKETCRDKAAALRLKIGAIASILAASTTGVCLPIVGRSVSALKPEKDLFFVIKAFAAGVILATGFVHVLPDAFESLTSRCLNDDPWGMFPFAGFVAMMAALCTLLVDSLAAIYYERRHFAKSNSPADPDNALIVARDTESGSGGLHQNRVHVHSHGSHGHAHGPTNDSAHEYSESSQLLRHRVISQVLELGIVAHSVIIGISLGASQSPCSVRPLVAALTFHQFFEGMGLGGCIVQAELQNLSTSLMAFFFSMTMPFGIAVGIGVSSIYNENSPTDLIVDGVFDAASAGILIYMSLVDLLAADFLNSHMQRRGAVQVLSYGALLSGAGAMSLMAKWA